MAALRVCIDARLPPGGFGGVEQVVFGLARGLLSLRDGDERYLFLTTRESADWLASKVSGDAELLTVPTPPEPAGVFNTTKAAVKRALPVLFDRVKKLPLPRAAHRLPGMRPPPPARSDGTIEKAGVDLMHFALQGAFLTDVPSVYQPHDLLHVHLPHMFSSRVRAWRDENYPLFCRRAEMVPVVSSWTKRDLIRQYDLDEGKVCVIEYAPILTEYPEPTPDDLRAAATKFGLPAEGFVFYPAQTFPHKNHLGLLEALAALRREGLVVPFVSSGRCNDFYPVIRRRVKKLGLEGQVVFAGFVTPLELQCLYRLARAAVIPTTFEAASFPVWEAFLAGVPVACSNVTSLPEQAGDAALVFDPADVSAMAAAVRRLWTDADLRGVLAERGRANVSRFSWDRTARLFRAHYRRICGRELTRADRDLLAAPPLL